MTIGISNITTVTYENITSIVNVSSFPEFMIRANDIIYNGYYWFIILWVTFFILFIAAQKVKDQPLNNAMYTSAVISILSFLLRGVRMVDVGVVKALLTDHQMWAFPIMTIILATIVWAVKD